MILRNWKTSFLGWFDDCNMIDASNCSFPNSLCRVVLPLLLNTKAAKAPNFFSFPRVLSTFSGQTDGLESGSCSQIKAG